MDGEDDDDDFCITPSGSLGEVIDLLLPINNSKVPFDASKRSVIQSE